MRKILEQCPACGGQLVATQLSCMDCDTVILGHFQPDIFSRLAPEDLDFIIHFVKNKGNIKEMERELDISYWTIRNRLNEVIERLGFITDRSDIEDEESFERQAQLSAERQEVLQQLERGELDVKAAAKELARLRDE